MIAKLQETDSSAGGVHMRKFHYYIFALYFAWHFTLNSVIFRRWRLFLSISYIWHKHVRSSTQSEGHWWCPNFAQIILLSKLSSLLLPSSESIYHFQKQYNIYTKWFPCRKGLFHCHIELLKWLLTGSQQDIDLAKSNIAQLSWWCVALTWWDGLRASSTPELCVRGLWPQAISYKLNRSPG